MNYQRCLGLLLLSVVSSGTPIYRGASRTPPQILPDQKNVAAPEFISAEQLKAKLARDEPITIIDVRSSENLENKRIKGSIYVKLRRLAYRLSMPPLKDLPRDREVVTYCACPHDEASIRAAQIISDAGFKRVRVLQGGWQVWMKANGPVASRPRA